jgi:hypothetical protein
MTCAKAGYACDHWMIQALLKDPTQNHLDLVAKNEVLLNKLQNSAQMDYQGTIQRIKHILSSFLYTEMVLIAIYSPFHNTLHLKLSLEKI